MNFINKQDLPPVLIETLREITQGISLKIQIVNRYIERLVTLPEPLLYGLEHKGSLPGSSRPQDSNTLKIPVYVTIQISLLIAKALEKTPLLTKETFHFV